MAGLIDALKIEGVTIVGQDWGGPIGLRYAIDHRENVRALVILNALVKITPVPLIFSLTFHSEGFPSSLIRRLDLFRKIAFGGKIIFKRALNRRAKERYKMPHQNAASRARKSPIESQLSFATKPKSSEPLPAIFRSLGKRR